MLREASTLLALIAPPLHHRAHKVRAQQGQRHGRGVRTLVFYGLRVWLQKCTTLRLPGRTYGH